MRKQVTIITVAYNSAATIAATLDSVAAQTWPYIEHIVIDGASTDKTPQIIASRKERVSIFISEKDHGIYDAMNKGLRLASGDVICFLNSDDVYSHPRVIEQVVKRMADESLDVLFGDVCFFKRDNPSRVIRRFRSKNFSPERLAWGWMPAHPALFMTNDVYKKTGFFNDSYRVAGDYEFIVRAFFRQNLRMAYVPEVFVRMQAGGISTAGIRSKILLNREVIRACRENGVRTNLFKILSKYPLKVMELLVIR